MQVRHRVWFELDTKLFGKGPAMLLQRVAETKSLREAAKQLGLSYTKAFNMIKTAEKQLGYPLLKRTIGGESGGGSTLSDQAIRLIERYDAMDERIQQFASDSLSQLEQADLAAELAHYQSARLISVIGGGGKTTLVNYLVKQRSHLGPTLLTSTTAMMKPADMPVDYGLITSVANPIALFSHEVHETKVKGVEPEVLDDIAQQGRFQSIICEADGSKGLPFKSYASHEPPIPSASDLIILVIGVDGFGQPIRDVVHRPDIYCQLTGAKETDRVTPENFLALFHHPQGSLKNCPNVPILVMLNRIEQMKDRGIIEPLVTGFFKDPRVKSVLLTELLTGRLEQAFQAAP